MQLGAFSISLSVKDIAASRAFYEKFGFEVLGGNQDENWLILKNGEAVIGLFQGMFEGNLLTFNPGWDQSAKPVGPFTDVREIQRRLKAVSYTHLDVYKRQARTWLVCRLGCVFARPPVIMSFRLERLFAQNRP